MAGLRLSFITGPHERVMPLIDGRVRIEGVDDVTTTISDASVTFWRQLTFWEFELAEMSLSSYLIARARGADMIAVPVFPTRRFMHLGLSINTESGVESAGDLVGKRIGVGDYQQTSSLWTRGILDHDFGVSQYRVQWWMERTPELSHGGATGFTPPPDIEFNYIPKDKSLASMLVHHEYGVEPNRKFLQTTIDFSHEQGLTPTREKVEDLFAPSTLTF